MSRRSSVVIVVIANVEDHSYWFSEGLFIFHVIFDGCAEKEEKLTFVQCFVVAPPKDEIDGKQPCLSL